MVKERETFLFAPISQHGSELGKFTIEQIALGVSIGATRLTPMDDICIQSFMVLRHYNIHSLCHTDLLINQLS